MMKGALPPTSQQLFRVQDRMTFLHLEYCSVSRESNAITASDREGTIHIPGAALSCVLLGPGTRITHHAVMLLAECGVTIVWVGEQGVRYYAHGTPLARSTRFLEAQAAAVSNTRSRLRVARRMYEMRFPDEVLQPQLTMQQLRGREGARVRALYRSHSQRTSVPWKRREYDPERFFDSDPINMALSAAHSCLYGVVHAAIVSLGCSPGLGFIHHGHARSFVYDIADLYKAEVTIPIAFDIVADNLEDISGNTRRRAREALRDGSVLERCVKDIRQLLLPDDDTDLNIEVLHLWDDRLGSISGGVDYSEADL